MNLRRWNNVTEARRSYRSTSPVAATAPIQAFFEVSARCNLRCAMCAINYDSRYKSSAGRPPYFTPELFARLRPIFPSLLRGFLFGLGEPLLNPHLVDYVRELAAQDVDVTFTTNATLIDDEKAEEIARAGVRHVTVSIDGARAETYEAIRIGATFERVLRGIRALTEAGRRHGGPTVSLSFVAMRSNVDDIPLLVDLCAEVGATGVHVEPLLSQVEGTALDDHYMRENLGLLDPDHVRGAIDEAAARASRLGVRFGSRLTAVKNEYDFVKSVAANAQEAWVCSEPWSTIWVTAAGEVRTCCLNDTSFGNLFEQTFEEIWNGARYRHFREQHARREVAEGCANCVVNGRAQQSEFFAAIAPVTYRPYFDRLPHATAGDSVVLNRPAAGETVSEPLYLEGHLRRGVDPRDIDVMIDVTPVANLYDSGLFDGRSFLQFVPTHFLTEGAHVLWLRDRTGSGWAHREIHFWRPSDDSAIDVLDQATIVMPRTLMTPRLRLDGVPRAVSWHVMRGRNGSRLVAHVDGSSLTGTHALTMHVNGKTVCEIRLRRSGLSSQ